MDYNIIPSTDIVGTVAGGATGYFETLAPIFIFVAGIILTVAIITMLIDLFNEWLYTDRILNEYTTLRQEESELLGSDFGDFKSEKENSRRMIRSGNINDSVVVTTSAQRLEYIEDRKRSLQSDF